jgi:hypothetical protein
MARFAKGLTKDEQLFQQRERRGQIMEIHICQQLNNEQIAKLVGVSTATVSEILTLYYHHKPDNPVTIVLQSKMNEPKKPEE